MPKALLRLPHSTRKEPLFGPGAQDDEWLSYVGQQGWIAFSHDGKFHLPGYENELAAIKQFSVGCFYLWGANHLRWQKALCFLRAYERIVDAARITPKPFIYQVTEKGTLKKVKLP